MLYEKPKLITLTGEAWTALGQCVNGISNPDGCNTGISAKNGSCNLGTGPQATACSPGEYANLGCNPGTHAGPATCIPGWDAGGCTPGVTGA